MKSHVAQVPWRSRPYSADVPDDGDVTPVEVLTVSYVCPNGHERTLPFAATAEAIPAVWDCNRCSLTAELVDPHGREVAEPEPVREYEPRSHYQEVLSRRTTAELQALLDERLAVYRSYRVGHLGMKPRSGEQVLTSHGNVTTPFPTVDVSTPRRATATVNRVNVWLIENARTEAELRKDTHGAFLLGAIDVRNLSQSDKDHAEAYLFG